MATWRGRRNLGDTAIIIFQAYYVLNLGTADLYQPYICFFRAEAMNCTRCHMKDLPGCHYMANDFFAFLSRAFLAYQCAL